MGSFPPLPPHDDPEAGPPGLPDLPAPGWPLATWGLVETLIGMVGTLLVVLGVVGFCFVLLVAVGLPLESAAVRYTVGVLGELMLVVVPVAIAILTKGGARSLGVRATRGRATLEAFGAGALLFLVTIGYEALIDRIAPEIAKKMAEEQKLQLEALAGPWPLLVLIAVVIAPLCEELFFRGFVFGGLRSRLDFGVASGLSALLFALVHLMAFSAVPLFFVGLGCAVMYERHRSLAAPVVTHMAFNGISLLVFFSTGQPAT